MSTAEYATLRRDIKSIKQMLEALLPPEPSSKGFVRIGELMKVTGLTRGQVLYIRRNNKDNTDLVRILKSGHYVYNASKVIEARLK